MKHQIALLTVILSMLVSGVCLAGITGEWLLESDFNGNTFQSILSITKNAEEKLEGYMINNFAMTELQDIKFEDNKLTFKQQMRGMNGESESTFSGTVEDDKLTGALSGEMGEFPMSGKKMPAQAPVGKWKFTREMQGQEIVTTLAVTANEEGKLSATMTGPRGENEMSDVAFKDGKLTFKRVLDFNGQTVELNYQFALEGGKLKGAVSTQRGEFEMEGVFDGPAIVGKWILTTSSDFGESMQLLMIYQDMSARYGTNKIKKIDYDADANTISFKYTMSFGGQSFDNSFSGKVEGEKLTGEVTNDYGETQVTGKKM